MKKKLFALLLVLCLLLTACSAAPVQESAEPTAAPEETAAEETQPEETTAPEEDSVFIVGTTAEILTANRDLRIRRRGKRRYEDPGIPLQRQCLGELAG